MRKLLIVLSLFITYMIYIDCQILSSVEKIIWKHGIAIINDKAKYIDAIRLDQRTMVLTKDYINKGNKTFTKNILKFGQLCWRSSNKLIVYDTEKDNPFDSITGDKYSYKIKNNTMYITKNNKEWDKLEIKIINEKPQQVPKWGVPIYMTIHLKCKWFEGEYAIIGTTG
ncbi:MAG: hypothetical protein SVZ03_02930 [Spirochaetota bacterium]|nr:hypothetical protein [Spirochaetota bacterium]